MVVVFVLLALGLALRRVPGFPPTAPKTLDLVVIWVALPAVIFREMSRLELRADTLLPVAAAWGTLALTAGCIALIGWARGWSRSTLGTLLVVVPLGNTSFLGFPAVDALLGRAALGAAVVYDQIGSFLALATWGTVMAARFGGGPAPTARAMLRRLVVFPPFVALVTALGVRAIGLPSSVSVVLDGITAPLGATLVPLAMLTVGLRLRLPRATSSYEPLAVGLVLRMAVAPAAVYGVAWWLGLGRTGWDPVSAASILEASMPPMVTAGVLASEAGLDEELAAALVGVGVLLAFVTAPAWAALLG